MIFKKADTIEVVLLNKKIIENSSGELLNIVNFLKDKNSTGYYVYYDSYNARHTIPLHAVTIIGCFIIFHRFDYNIFNKLVDFRTGNIVL